MKKRFLCCRVASHASLIGLAAWLTLACSPKQAGERATAGQDFYQAKELKEAVFRSDRIFLDIPSAQGDTVHLYTDTGGGNVLSFKAAELLNLELDTILLDSQSVPVADISEVLSLRGIPVPVKPLFVRGEKDVFAGSGGDGMLGTYWFGGKIWKLDYPNQKLAAVSAINWAKVDKSDIIRLGFAKNPEGKSSTHFPRVPIVVDEDTIQVLFDTGAHAVLSNGAKKEFGNIQAIGTSFITKSIFERWEENHPDWKVIKAGDKLADEDMIQVPRVTIGKHTVGPVWFTRRDDENFTQFMSQWMDKEVAGAIGGSALKHFRTILIDYQKDLLYLQK